MDKPLKQGIGLPSVPHYDYICRQSLGATTMKIKLLKKTGKILLDALEIVLIGVFIAVVLTVLSIPGFKVMAVLTGSMTPAIPAGSLVFVSPGPNTHLMMLLLTGPQTMPAGR